MDNTLILGCSVVALGMACFFGGVYYLIKTIADD